MLTVAYCRVSTEEQAAEGFSIEGQAEKLRSYADLHDLGPVTVIEDPGRSGKDMDRPGLQRILAMVEAGHVAHVLIWRLDRLSRNLGDLLLLADTLGEAGVGLHSFNERIDLSTATGRMFYNILGSFAQFYREQLAENVRLGMRQAAREGRWTNRPKFGYRLVEGRLEPDENAGTVRRIFRLRAEGRSYREIAEATSVKYSTVASILASRVYLGEVLLSGEWFAGIHEPLVTSDEFAAAHRGHVPGWRRGRDLLAGRVRCGLCGRRATVHWARDGRPMYRCRHRGQGCHQRARSASGLERAALLGMRLLAEDGGLREEVLREAERARGTRPGDRERVGHRKRLTAVDLAGRRRKLLDLYYADKIDAEGFGEEDARLEALVREAEEVEREARAESRELDEIAERFEEVARLLREIDVERLWEAATAREKRELVEELVEEVVLFPDHLEVQIAGAPRLNVLLGEVGLKDDLQSVRVGGGI